MYNLIDCFTKQSFLSTLAYILRSIESFLKQYSEARYTQNVKNLLHIKYSKKGEKRRVGDKIQLTTPKHSEQTFIHTIYLWRSIQKLLKNTTRRY